MILFDIDGTLSPARTTEAPPTAGVTAHAWIFNIFIPQHLLDFLNSRDDIVLLSTWNNATYDVVEAFGLDARVALMEDFSEEVGIKGKFEVVKALQPLGWADDHIKLEMKKYAADHGIAVTVPKLGYVTEKELANFVAAIDRLPAREPHPKDSLLLRKRANG